MDDEKKRLAELLKECDDDVPAKRQAAWEQLIKMGMPIALSLQTAAKESASAEVRMRARTAFDKLSAQKTSLVGHNDNIKTIRFAPDGKTLATADNGGIVIVWDTTTGKELWRWDAAK
jgi:WD40 repeat protein